MASPGELRTREIGDEHLPGYAELYAELAPANPGINAAIHALGQGGPHGQELLRAEVLATAGRMGYDQGDIGDSISPLVNAEAQWTGLGEMADNALKDAAQAKTPSADLVALADQLRVMAAAVDPGHEVIPLKGLRQDD